MIATHKILGQIVVLTKNIWLAEPITDRGYAEQFSPGRRSPFALTGGIGLTWWYTHRGFKTVEIIASMLLQSVTELEACDTDTAEETIRRTLREICVDSSMFKPDEVIFSHQKSLFNHRAIANASDFAAALLQAILDNLKSQIFARCTVYVAPCITGPTFSIPPQGITVLSRADQLGWNAIQQKGYQTNGWTPVTGKFVYGNDVMFSKLKYNYVFLCEEIGTRRGTHFSAELKLRRLFAILFAVISERVPGALVKSAGDPYRLSLQFSSSTSKDGTLTTSGFDPLVPFYIDEHVLTASDISSIVRWYDRVSRLAPETASRVEKGAHFVNRAMNASGIESYVNYFVALDALFGEIRDVERSITSAVNTLGLDPSMGQKISWLFDLRNELVHGGSRYVKEWPQYQRYYRHFNTTPSDDVEKLAFAALLRAPEALSGCPGSAS
jgi:hypothetical protein